MASNLHPIILVPGQTGNQLEAKLTSHYNPSLHNCDQPSAQDRHKWFRIWKDQSLLTTSASLQCFSEQLSLVYDAEADDYRNIAGVETRVPFFGSTQGMRFLDPDNKEASLYMDNFVTSLEAIGYREGENLFGAPYDFRYSLAAQGHPSKVMSKYLHDLTKLVEKASELNGNMPVIIVTHSFGGLLVLQFLNRHPLSWREKYVKHFISLAAPWGGFVKEMRIFASGESMGLASIDPLLLRDQMRRTESNLWLLPSPKVFGERPLVITKEKQYAAADMAEFLEAIGFGEGVEPYKSRVLPLFDEMLPPGVPMTCVAGAGVDTPETLVYGEDGGFNRLPEIVYGDGDGLVNLESLEALESLWASYPEQKIKVMKIPNASHSGILMDEVAINQIMQEIFSINSMSLISTS